MTRIIARGFASISRRQEQFWCIFWFKSQAEESCNRRIVQSSVAFCTLMFQKDATTLSRPSIAQGLGSSDARPV